MPDIFIADLHIHSRFSRATSGKLSAAHLAAWAMAKGIRVLGTGDFTHPAWRSELKSNLETDPDSGLYRLKEPFSPSAELPEPLGEAVGKLIPPLFMPQAEISSIYKKHGRVRKVHNLVFMPDWDCAERFCRLLEGVGNLASDGRPILGLDSAVLLDMVLNCHPEAVLIPAHIWTPWFSVFGSKSGFDSLEECFGDLAGEVFAAETGLSSDPPMNRLWSHLDRLSLVSNSDAHSGENLGREGNVFNGPPSYSGIFQALRKKPSSCEHWGSLEFFPEEGKYHLDGHRECGVVMDPEESKKLDNLCPVCGKKMTIGVLNRVMALADRAAPPVWLAPTLESGGENRVGFASLIPLPEIIGEILGVGSKSKAVMARYAKTVDKFGPELEILQRTEIADLRRYWDALGEAVERMRRGAVIRQGGYDGQYGRIRVFSDKERAGLKASGRGLKLLPDMDMKISRFPAGIAGGAPEEAISDSAVFAEKDKIFNVVKEDQPIRLTEGQEDAIAGCGPTLVVAGPGAGKTRTLVERVLRLIKQGAEPGGILALTFTRSAAEEMLARLKKALGQAGPLPECRTLHSLAWKRLQNSPNPPVLLPESGLRELFAGLAAERGLAAAEAGKIFEACMAAREKLTGPPEALQELAEAYAELKAGRNFADHTDILEKCLQIQPAGVYSHVLVDEIQDLTPLQLALIRKLTPESGQGFFGIGDPNQSIYSFRGVQGDIAAALRAFWPDLEVKSLAVSHRTAQQILDAANSLLPGQNLRAAVDKPATMRLFNAPDEYAEARWVAAHVAELLGGTSLSGSGRAKIKKPAGMLIDVGHLQRDAYGPDDIAVLVRLKAQIPPLAEALRKAGLPCAAPEEEGFWHNAQVAAILNKAAEYALPADADSLLRPQPEADAVWAALPEKIWQEGPQGLARHFAGREPFEDAFVLSEPFKALAALWRKEGDWASLLNEVSFRSDLDEVKNRAERVRIMTMHASKGLEFAAVFICGLEYGLIPLDIDLLRPRGETQDDAPLQPDVGRASLEAEERRLLNVGLTRAAEAVFVSRVEHRTIWGRSLALDDSPFTEALRPYCRSSVLKTRSRKIVKKIFLFDSKK